MNRPPLALGLLALLDQIFRRGFVRPFAALRGACLAFVLLAHGWGRGLAVSPFRSGGKPAATAAYYDGPLRCFNRGTTPAADLSAYRFAFGVGGLHYRAWSSPMQFGKHQETPRLDVYEVLAGQSLQSFSRKSIL